MNADHRQLCELAARLVEQHFYHCQEYPWRFLIETGLRRENPDVFAFTRYRSILFECKVSRADFLRDKKKPFRINPSMGIGESRYYLCKKGVAKENEMPDGWYLFEALDENTVSVPPDFEFDGCKSEINKETGCMDKFQVRNASAETELMWSWEYRKKRKLLPTITKGEVIIIRREKEGEE